MVVHKFRRVGNKINLSSVWFTRFHRFITTQFASFKNKMARLSIAIGRDLKPCTQRIDGFQTHTIETYAFLEHLVIIFSTSVQLTDGFHQFALRNASTIVTHPHALLFGQVNIYAFSKIHSELIYTVVDDLLHQHVDAILCMRPIAQSTNIHARTHAHVLHVVQMANTVIAIFGN